jgi:hypothetical protein
MRANSRSFVQDGRLSTVRKISALIFLLAFSCAAACNEIRTWIDDGSASMMMAHTRLTIHHRPYTLSLLIIIL